MLTQCLTRRLGVTHSLLWSRSPVSSRLSGAISYLNACLEVTSRGKGRRQNAPVKITETGDAFTLLFITPYSPAYYHIIYQMLAYNYFHLFSPETMNFTHQLFQFVSF